MVGWNTHKASSQESLSLSRPQPKTYGETSSMTTEEEEKIKFLPAYPSPLLLSIDTQLLQIPFYFIFSFQIGAN
jgi:hypothetical protein